MIYSFKKTENQLIEKTQIRKKKEGQRREIETNFNGNKAKSTSHKKNTNTAGCDSLSKPANNQNKLHPLRCPCFRNRAGMSCITICYHS